MHHLFQTKKRLRDLRQSDFHSSAAQVRGDDWSAELHFPGDHCIPLSCTTLPQASKFLALAGWFLAAWMKAGWTTERWRDKSLPVFPWRAADLQHRLFLLPHPKWAGWEDVSSSFSWVLWNVGSIPLTTVGKIAVLGVHKDPKYLGFS